MFLIGLWISAISEIVPTYQEETSSVQFIFHTVCPLIPNTSMLQSCIHQRSSSSCLFGYTSTNNKIGDEKRQYCGLTSGEHSVNWTDYIMAFILHSMATSAIRDRTHTRLFQEQWTGHATILSFCFCGLLGTNPPSSLLLSLYCSSTEVGNNVC